MKTSSKRPRLRRAPDDLPQILWEQPAKGSHDADTFNHQFAALVEYLHLDEEDEAFWVDLVIDLMHMVFPAVAGHSSKRPGRKPKDWREEIRVGEFWHKLKLKYTPATMPTNKQIINAHYHEIVSFSSLFVSKSGTELAFGTIDNILRSAEKRYLAYAKMKPFLDRDTRRLMHEFGSS